MRTDITEVIHVAREQIGKPYVWGGSGPRVFDCSGLACYAYGIPHVATGTLIHMGTGIRFGDLRPGDLIFPNPHHVQIYTGATHFGPHTIIEAPRSGEDVREREYWGFWAARRLVGHPTPHVTHPPQAHSSYYTVKRGDNLSLIAERVYHNARRWTVLAAANHIRPPYIIHPGQKLKVP